MRKAWDFFYIYLFFIIVTSCVRGFPHFCSCDVEARLHTEQKQVSDVPRPASRVQSVILALRVCSFNF